MSYSNFDLYLNCVRNLFNAPPGVEHSLVSCPYDYHCICDKSNNMEEWECLPKALVKVMCEDHLTTQASATSLASMSTMTSTELTSTSSSMLTTATALPNNEIEFATTGNTTLVNLTYIFIPSHILFFHSILILTSTNF